MRSLSGISEGQNYQNWTDSRRSAETPLIPPALAPSAVFDVGFALPGSARTQAPLGSEVTLTVLVFFALWNQVSVNFGIGMSCIYYEL